MEGRALTDSGPPTLRDGVGFWFRIALLGLLVAGTADALLLLVPDGIIAFVSSAGGGGVVFTAGYLLALCLTPTVLGLAALLVRSLRGWTLARRDDPGYLASPGTAGWRAVAVALALANTLALVPFLVVASAGPLDPVRSWSAVACAVSNVWVCLYYRPARRWDGARAPDAGARVTPDL
ncbi:hypothetical protein [Demequina zhanjiangensis]|uniref:Uncharacterized protein n=1 Tax=Demequina zhanjiangensis TaxID=3051659 RepID=A0ABT8G0E6_9MICO|nr:hypothetical protein [Demequina sp. SYSU T00b26]MDN4472616.1 hypothetical protein [Demequina sp. SYSU T00b26]